MRNKFLAAFLALSCGILDKFYLGRSAAGWIRIGLCFIFPIIPFLALVGFVEALRLFGMSQREFDRKYNKDELVFHSRNQSRRGQADTPRVRVRGKGAQYRHADRRSGGAEDRPISKPDSSNPSKYLAVRNTGITIMREPFMIFKRPSQSSLAILPLTSTLLVPIR